MEELNDLELFIKTYKQFGVEIVTYIGSNGNTFIDLNDDAENSTKSQKFNGYGGFFSDIEFDKNGKFIRQGFWE
jgi:hypothetical protein